MKKKRGTRYSKVQKAIVYIRDIGRGYVRVHDPESLRQACFTISNYVEILELNATENARRNAAHETETIMMSDSRDRAAAFQFTLLTEGTTDE